MERNYAEQYVQTNVATVPQERLIVLLYEGAIRFAQAAVVAIEQGDVPERGRQVDRAVRIVHELRSALDMEAGGEVAQRLAALYDFVADRLVSANAQASAPDVNAAIRVMSTLLVAWRRALQPDAQAAAPSPAVGPTIPPPMPARTGGLSLVA